MFLGGLFLLFAAPGSPLSANDAAFLSRIDRAVSRMSDRKTAFVQFEKTVTKADAIRCNQVLPNLKPNSVSYADCAFVQAWYGVDYDANIQRLLRPYLAWRAQGVRYEKEYPNVTSDESLTGLDGLSSALNWLYLKHHDLKSLGTWEDLSLDGAPAEGNSDELAELWKRHAVDMLKAAYKHKDRIEGLSESVTFGSTAYDNKERAKELLADVKSYTRNKDPRVAQTAAQLYRAIKSDLHQFNSQNNKR